MGNAQFDPVGSIVLVVSLLLLGWLVLYLALLARGGGPKRNPVTADPHEMRSVIWTSVETWQAAHRAHAPWLLAGAIGLFAAAVFSLGAILTQGAGPAVHAVLAATCVALLLMVVCCMVAGISGRIAAKRVLSRPS